LLAEQFVRELCEEYSKPKMEITKKAMDELIRLDWDGNIRELRNVMERMIILCDRQITDQDVLTFAVPRKYKRADTNIYDMFEKFQEFKDYAEKEFIERKLRKNSWNITKTAEEIDIQRSHLYNKIEKFGLRREENIQD
jgi:DNA-binding NtrC family response regulator